MHKVYVVYLSGDPLPWWAWALVSFSFTTSVCMILWVAGVFGG